MSERCDVPTLPCITPTVVYHDVVTANTAEKMEITKTEALALAKVLHNNVQRHPIIHVVDRHEDVLRSLVDKVDAFLLDSEGSGKVDGTWDPETEPVSIVAPSELASLTPARSTVGGLGFALSYSSDKRGERECADLCIDHVFAVGEVAFVKRCGKSLEVKSVDGTWSNFEVSRFGRGWADTLRLGITYAVGAK